MNFPISGFANHDFSVQNHVIYNRNCVIHFVLDWRPLCLLIHFKI